MRFAVKHLGSEPSAWFDLAVKRIDGFNVQALGAWWEAHWTEMAGSLLLRCAALSTIAMYDDCLCSTSCYHYDYLYYYDDNYYCDYYYYYFYYYHHHHHHHDYYCYYCYYCCYCYYCYYCYYYCYYYYHHYYCYCYCYYYYYYDHLLPAGPPLPISSDSTSATITTRVMSMMKIMNMLLLLMTTTMMVMMMSGLMMLTTIRVLAVWYSCVCVPCSSYHEY